MLFGIIRISRPEVFCKKDVLRIFTKFIGKYPCQGLFFNKVAGLRRATLLKKNFVKFLIHFLHRTPLEPPEVIYVKSVLRNFTKFFFNKVAFCVIESSIRK